ncbi:polycystin-2-like protein 1 isoform X2 [Tachypleus tridentatus]|uniref:polycystin-2-like protein 1 isoform X2 n=1 Tax=Tachypleus tridentatus TaxID=6853 RepID=UPI003FD65908
MNNLGKRVLKKTPPKKPKSNKNAWDIENEDLEVLGLEDPCYDKLHEADVIPEKERRGCWYDLTRAIGGCWSTRQMKKETFDREWYIKTTLRELLIYSIFIAILTILTFGMVNPMMYYQTKVISELFLDTPFMDTRNSVRGSTQLLDFWRFVDYVMLDSLYWETWYNNNVTNLEDRNILYENRLLGTPRLRQLRVRNDSCNIHENFKETISKCYDIYSPEVEDTEPFGLLNGTAWTYYSEKEVNGSTHWGLIETYGGGGSYADLGTNRSQAAAIMKELRENLWITRATRAIFLDFTTYNANVNLFCVAKIVFEFPATGGMIPSWSFRTVKLLRYVSVFDYIVLACECIFSFLIIYYVVEEFIEIKDNSCKYFKSIWNLLDILVILISLVCIAFSAFRTITVESMMDKLLENPDHFADFEFLGFWQTQFNNAVAVTVFFAWIKIFKYISFNRTMTQLSSTLSRCSKDIAGFGIMFCIVFFAYAQLGLLLFGTQIQDFSKFIKATFTLLRIILGDFDFHEIERANRIIGPTFFITYVFFVFFVLLNMFLAIINETYAEVKAEISSQKNEFEIADFLKRGYNNLMGRVGKRDKIIDIQSALKLADQDGNMKLSFDEIQRALKRQNFTNMEIEMLFVKYDRTGNWELDANETKAMLADLEGEKTHFDRLVQREGGYPSDDQGEVSIAMLNGLSGRVDKMERCVGTIVAKIDAMIEKMDTMKKAKSEELNDKFKWQQLEKMLREELQRRDSEASLKTTTNNSWRPEFEVKALIYIYGYFSCNTMKQEQLVFPISFVIFFEDEREDPKRCYFYSK